MAFTHWPAGVKFTCDWKKSSHEGFVWTVRDLDPATIQRVREAAARLSTWDWSGIHFFMWSETQPRVTAELIECIGPIATNILHLNVYRYHFGNGLIQTIITRSIAVHSPYPSSGPNRAEIVGAHLKLWGTSDHRCIGHRMPVTANLLKCHGQCSLASPLGMLTVNHGVP